MNEPTRKKSGAIYLGIFLASIIIAAPLAYHQFPDPRAGFFMFPVCFVIIIFFVSWILNRISVWNKFQVSAAKGFPIILLIITCISSGFFSAWFAAALTDSFGIDGWRGNVLVSNMLSASAGLACGLWGAYSIRLLQRPRSKSRVLIVFLGAIAGELLWIFAERLNEIPAFWTIIEVIPRSSHPEHAVYFLFESLIGQVIWPLGIISALYLYWFGGTSKKALQ